MQVILHMILKCLFFSMHVCIQSSLNRGTPRKPPCIRDPAFRVNILHLPVLLYLPCISCRFLTRKQLTLINSGRQFCGIWTNLKAALPHFCKKKNLQWCDRCKANGSKLCSNVIDSLMSYLRKVSKNRELSSEASDFINPKIKINKAVKRKLFSQSSSSGIDFKNCLGNCTQELDKYQNGSYWYGPQMQKNFQFARCNA